MGPTVRFIKGEVKLIRHFETVFYWSILITYSNITQGILKLNGNTVIAFGRNLKADKPNAGGSKLKEDHASIGQQSNQTPFKKTWLPTMLKAITENLQYGKGQLNYLLNFTNTKIYFLQFVYTTRICYTIYTSVCQVVCL